MVWRERDALFQEFQTPRQVAVLKGIPSQEIVWPRLLRMPLEISGNQRLHFVPPDRARVHSDGQQAKRQFCIRSALCGFEEDLAGLIEKLSAEITHSQREPELQRLGKIANGRLGSGHCSIEILVGQEFVDKIKAITLVCRLEFRTSLEGAHGFQVLTFFLVNLAH